MGIGGECGHRPAYFVARVPVFENGRPPRHDFGELLAYFVRLASLDELIETRITVVEIFEQREVINLLEVGIRLVLGEPRRQVHSHLLKAQRNFYGRFVTGGLRPA